MNQINQKASTPSAPAATSSSSSNPSPEKTAEKGALSLVRIEIAEIAKAIARSYAARESLAEVGPLHRV